MTNPITPLGTWADEYLALQGGQTVSVDAIQAARRLKNRNLPSKLYKFRPVNEFSLKNLRTDTVWMSSASNFNDPYDCAMTWEIEQVGLQFSKANIHQILEGSSLAQQLSVSEIREVKLSSDPMAALTRCIFRRQGDLPMEIVEKLVEEFRALSGDLSRDNIARMNRAMQQGMKICSFSALCDSIVMWGHYANNHTGFAIEYDVTIWPEDDHRRNALHPVIYKETLFDATCFQMTYTEGSRGNNLFGILAAMHKAKEWEYENEWRFIFPLGETFADYDFRIGRPSALYIGSRASPHTVLLLSAIAKKKDIPVYQMQQSTSEFKLVPRTGTAL